jgi:hypothetical protein
LLVSGGLTGGPCGTAGDGGLGGVGMRSWGVDRITGSIGTAVAEPAADAGVGSDGAGGVSGMAIFGGMDGSSKRLTVAAGPGLPRFASISCVKVAGAGVDMGLRAPAGMTGGSCVCARAGSGTKGTGESEKDLAGDA